MVKEEVFLISVLISYYNFPDQLLKLLREEEDFSVIVEPRSSLSDHIDYIHSRIKVDILMLEVEYLQDLPKIRRLLQKRKDLKVVVIGDLDGRLALEYLKSGVKGCLHSTVSPDLLSRALRKVYKGEVWVDRSTTSMFFNDFSQLALESGLTELISRLSLREKEVLRMVALGRKNRDIAKKLFISEKTVKNHLSQIFEKLEVNDRFQAALLLMKSKETP